LRKFLKQGMNEKVDMNESVVLLNALMRDTDLHEEARGELRVVDDEAHGDFN